MDLAPYPRSTRQDYRMKILSLRYSMFTRLVTYLENINRVGETAFTALFARNLACSLGCMLELSNCSCSVGGMFHFPQCCIIL